MAEAKKKPGRPPGSKNKNSGQRKTASQNTAYAARTMDPAVKDEIWSIVIIALGAFLVVAFQTHAAGAVGEGLSNFFKGCLGMIAYALPYYLILYGILLFARKTIHIGGKSVILLFIILLTASFINSARFIDPQMLAFGLADAADYYRDGIVLDSGGLFGMYIGSLLVKAFGIPGLYIISIVVIISCLLLIINTPISRFFERAAEKRRIRKEEDLLEDEEDLQVPAMLPEKAEKKEKKRATIRQKLEKEQGIQEEMDLSKRQKLSSQLDSAQPRHPDSGTSYVPGRISPGQKNILEYMKDDDLFSGGAEDEGYGLDEEPKLSNGFGLEPDLGMDDMDLGVDPVEDTPQGLGLTDDSEHPGGSVTKGSHQAEPLTDNHGGIQEALPIAAGTLKKEPEKISNSQAAKASLDPSEINAATQPVPAYRFPPAELLNKASTPQNRSGITASLKAKALKLEETLQNFHIDAQVVQVTQGPAVTRYEIHPNVGVKVKSIVNLADDIALNLEAKSIRIEAPIPGKAAVGIEVENDKVNMVTIREIIDSREFKNSKSKITFTVGKDIAGNAIVADLKSMPHLLIAGSTGSGKSVCVNSIITSILYKAKPEEVKLVLIDPKVVELTNYNGIPHLLIPVVTEPTKAAAALNWAVAEMEDRYKKFAEEGVRELASYNTKVKKDGEEDKFLPQVVIIIDELADLMMAAPSQVEESICRLAQKARAAGMHLIVATQRPSVDVITGVIKANIPSRIAFAVSSQFDSRTILDMAGAEKLVGKGDMLFNPMGGGKPTRVQGTFISDSEVHDVIEFVKGQVTETEYSDEVIHTIEKVNTPEKEDDADELLPEAIETVVSAGQASVSMLQRRFRIGYNRAARIVDMMEARGIIGPSEGSKPRQVLMTEAELNALNNDTEEMEEE
ncbi:DNA translocase FtsK [Anaerovorax odorimutans]|uniref:DNA translocase FtsK n=1 Tax=Anaerovorax odorimutans TaxID=109327 RepID=A0ABT1RKV0_9FIRM|nr:DNA translocase FtsK [Anaerovorax odorimutans]MCQ4635811.1 DNA translocase FtsK [Anaerovorax odorimutans]